jgi:ribose-phosphate pyrophosphokinase
MDRPPLLFALPGNEVMTAKLANRLGAEVGEIETRRFPDEETYLRFLTVPAGRSVALVCTLDHPDPKFLPLVFAASAARQLGAERVGLIAPYLCYLRQDKRFHPGEAITSVSFARSLSSEIDWLVTVDPHLHRHRSLGAVYSVPSRVAAAAPAIAGWIAANVPHPFLIGPDSESEQWVAHVAGLIGAPYRVLSKERLGDRSVRITMPDLAGLADRTPVLVDDIVSSAQTMLEAITQLRRRDLPAPACVAVHALFSPKSFARLRESAGLVATTNSVNHASSAIDVSEALATAASDLAKIPTRSGKDAAVL